MDILEETMKTWDHSIAIYEERHEEVVARYGATIAHRSLDHLRKIPLILQKYTHKKFFITHHP